MLQTLKNSDVPVLEAVRELLGHVPSLEIGSIGYAEKIGRDYRIDARIGFKHGEIGYELIIEVKSNGAPRFVRNGAYQLRSYLAHLRQSEDVDGGKRFIPMLISSYLSPESRAICTDHKIAYLDLVGNAHLAFGDVYIDRAVAGKPKSESRALRSIFTRKAAAIVRVMLREPNRAWRVTDLAKQANASLGHVSNVRKMLLTREWIESQDDGVVLIQPDVLLKTWRENYRQRADRRISGYTYLHGKQLDDRLLGKLNSYPERPRAIYSLNSSAQWLAAYGRGGTYSFYADEPGVQLLRETLKLTPAAKGANVILRVPIDESPFDDAIQPKPGIFCTSPITTYLDLWNGNDRDREAAEYLARECFPWLR